MTYRLVIEGRLPGLNEYIAAERSHRAAAARMKAETQELIGWTIRAQLGAVRITRPVWMRYTWVEPNRRRDRDNIAFAHKFVQHAHLHEGVLQGDGWKHILGHSDAYAVDKDRPRVEVELEEVVG